METLDLGHQIGLEIILNGILTELRSCFSGGDGIGHPWGEVF
jgi:hypothetical protein